MGDIGKGIRGLKKGLKDEDKLKNESIQESKQESLQRDEKEINPPKE